MAVLNEIIKLTRRLHLSDGDRIQPLRWRPAIDVYRTPEGWLVKVELAGVRHEDIEVLTKDRLLTLRGRRSDTEIWEGCEFYSMEITYNQFERSIELPGDLEQSETITDYRDGMLFVRIIVREP